MSKANKGYPPEPQRGVEQSAPMGEHEAEMQRRADAAQNNHMRETVDTYEERQAERAKERRRDDRKIMAAHIYANIIKGQEKATKQIARDCVKHAEELLAAIDEYNAAEDKAG